MTDKKQTPPLERIERVLTQIQTLDSAQKEKNIKSIALVLNGIKQTIIKILEPASADPMAQGNTPKEPLADQLTENKFEMAIVIRVNLIKRAIMQILGRKGEKFEILNMGNIKPNEGQAADLRNIVRLLEKVDSKITEKLAQRTLLQEKAQTSEPAKESAEEKETTAFLKALRINIISGEGAKIITASTWAASRSAHLDYAGDLVEIEKPNGSKVPLTDDDSKDKKIILTARKAVHLPSKVGGRLRNAAKKLFGLGNNYKREVTAEEVKAMKTYRLERIMQLLAQGTKHLENLRTKSIIEWDYNEAYSNYREVIAFTVNDLKEMGLSEEELQRIERQLNSFREKFSPQL